MTRISTGELLLALATAAGIAGCSSSTDAQSGGASVAFKLGTFERSGGRPFVGLVLKDSQVVDIGQANQAHEAANASSPKLTAPALLLWGDQDRVDPPGGGTARAMLAALPDARASVVADAGHLVWIDKPDECARQIVQFLG